VSVTRFTNALKKICRRIEKAERGIANPINFNVASRSTFEVSSPNQAIRDATANRSASIIVRMIALHITIALSHFPGELLMTLEL
jgi:hypothetical protein